MTETEAQKRERILHSERTHADGILPLSMASFQAAISPEKPPGEDIDAPLHELLACPNDWIKGRGGPITSFVVHCTAATNPASSTANFFHSCASDHGSTQYVLDDDEGYLCVPLDAICAGAPPLNQEGVHAEQPGLVTWTRATWLSHTDQLRRMAFWAAKTCKDNNLPVRLLHAADLIREGEKAKGITYHAAISDAFHQSTHNDPGPNFPFDVFMSLVQGFFDGKVVDEMSDFADGWNARKNATGANPALPPGKPELFNIGWHDQDRLLALEHQPASTAKLPKHTHTTPAGQTLSAGS